MGQDPNLWEENASVNHSSGYRPTHIVHFSASKISSAPFCCHPSDAYHQPLLLSASLSPSHSCTSIFVVFVMNISPLPGVDDNIRSSESDLFMVVAASDDPGANRLALFSSWIAFELFVSYVPFPRADRRLYPVDLVLFANQVKSGVSDGRHVRDICNYVSGGQLVEQVKSRALTPTFISMVPQSTSIVESPERAMIEI